MKQYLLFDLDRTLWDFDGNADRTYRAMFEEFDIQSLCHADYETFHERYKVINDVLWESYRNGTLAKELLAIRRFSYTLAAFGCDADSPEIVRLSNRMSDYYVEEGTRQTGLMPGAREVLEWLDTQRDHFVMAVITNGFSEAQLPKMKTAGIDRYFDYFFLSEDLGYMKPDRRFFDAAIAKMGVRPEQCLVIGDDYKVDILGAMAAGIPQMWYNPGGVTLPENSAQPTYEIRELEEMKEMLPSGAQASSLHIQLETMQAGSLRSGDFLQAGSLRSGEWHSRGYLPHRELQQYQFITFRLYDSLPKSVVDELKELLDHDEKTSNESIRYSRLHEMVSEFEDSGYGACFMSDDKVAEIVNNALLHFDNDRYHLIRWCIMPNHVHVLIEVKEGWSLSSIIHSWRSFSANKANKLLDRSGKFWMKEYFDRYIRDDKHLRDVINYIDNNPVKAGLVKSPEKWRWCSAWYDK